MGEFAPPAHALGRVVGGLVLYPRVIRAHLMDELPFLVTEDILMAATKQGADRQDAHEVIRGHSREAARRVKVEGLSNDLLDRLQADSGDKTMGLLFPGARESWQAAQELARRL